VFVLFFKDFGCLDFKGGGCFFWSFRICRVFRGLGIPARKVSSGVSFVNDNDPLYVTFIQYFARDTMLSYFYVFLMKDDRIAIVFLTEFRMERCFKS
jgi:hypothetical protein